MKNITQEPMNYKTSKKYSEDILKVRMLKDIHSGEYKVNEIAFKYQCSRNTVTNLKNRFKNNLDAETKLNILHSTNQTQEQITKYISPLKDKSRAPLNRHPKQCSSEQEDIICRIQRRTNWGYKRLHLMSVLGQPPNSKYKDMYDVCSLKGITLGQIRGVYRRNKLKHKKRVTVGKTRRALYNYKSIRVFEHIHIDVKYILDKKALPKQAYDALSSKRNNIPKYSINIVDAKSRFKFSMVCYSLSREYTEKFLLSTIMFIRSVTNNYDMHINVYTDNGAEFMGSDDRVTELWNSKLSILNASISRYNPHFDIRKNIIERSHRTDDDYFLAPRGAYCTSKRRFLKEMRDYLYEYNNVRAHQGVDMNGRTPIQVMRDEGVFNVDKLNEYKAIVVEDNNKELGDVISILSLVNELGGTKVPL